MAHLFRLPSIARMSTSSLCPRRADVARTMLRWLGYSAIENLQRNVVNGQTRWQVTAYHDDHVVVARAPTRTAAWYEACRMGEWLQTQD